MRDAVNGVLKSFGVAKIKSLAQLYFDAVDCFLTTIEELDVFGPRENAHYWGVLPYNHGNLPVWPVGNGPRVFAYLRSFDSLNHLFGLLRASDLRTVLYLGGATAEECKVLSTRNTQVTNRPV